MARPSSFTSEIADEICERIAQGASLVRILKDEEMPGYTTISRWLEKDEVFRANYARARERQADHYADEIVEIGDTSDDPAKARLQMDARRWYAGKLKPKVYGDKQNVEVSGKDGAALIPEKSNTEIAQVALLIASTLGAKALPKPEE